MEQTLQNARAAMLEMSNRLALWRKMNFPASMIAAAEREVIKSHDRVWEVQCMMTSPFLAYGN